MRRLLLPLMGLAALGCSVFLSGCNVACSARSDKLTALKRGMTYDEVSEIMGCGGDVVTAAGPRHEDFAIVEWAGPMIFSNRTRMEFLDGRLVSYTTERRGAGEAFTQPPP